ncbi:hypothetical protein OW684_01725 [Acinetobacter baumannii]|uniref:hypothetical protein n=1 Tax=Acinetobacter baumannii TaxID=470 RepID=UPI002340B22D|nr:hypothetical protein [Acinetobacter baumannii]MDC5111994.1 hypothetical protein [Acinetobacter baumannii]MDK2105132.1 hypothetical protein [Acinetobacter baumannii]MDK2110468.1 hypothetical protein [Acinetobacter baumannii]MDK2139978.1 hypothetical protein [Acinetobacter baumannii]MDK2150848.1 hypothetical protein [Acinetobacter baumannii]
MSAIKMGSIVKVNSPKRSGMDYEDWLWVVMSVNALKGAIKVAKRNADRTVSSKWCFWVPSSDVAPATQEEKEAGRRL